MSDFKSKLPDLKELSSMTSKLFKGLKESVSEIIKDYKEKRTTDEATIVTTETVKTEEVKKETVKPVETVEKVNPDSDDKPA